MRQSRTLSPIDVHKICVNRYTAQVRISRCHGVLLIAPILSSLLPKKKKTRGFSTFSTKNKWFSLIPGLSRRSGWKNDSYTFNLVVTGKRVPVWKKIKTIQKNDSWVSSNSTGQCQCILFKLCIPVRIKNS